MQTSPQMCSCNAWPENKIKSRIKNLDVGKQKHQIATKKEKIPLIQWGSEIGPFEIRKHLVSGLFEGQISNSPDHSKTGKNCGFSQDCFIYSTVENRHLEIHKSEGLA